MSPPSNTLTISVTPAIPVASAVTPATVPALQGALAVTVTGDFLSSTSTVYFNGSARPTTAVNNGVQLIAQLTASDVMAPGTASITIEDPLSGNVASNPLSFSITALPPLSLGSLSPATVPAGNGAFTLTVFGNGFTTDSIVAWNGTPLPTTHVSVTTLRASVSAAQVASTGTVPVTVVNPAAQGGTSPPLTLTITAPSIDSVAYQIDTGHTGSIQFKSVTLPTAASWSVNVGGAPSYALIVAGRVFVIANANGNSQLLALNAATGATLWGPIAYSGAAGIAHDAGTIFVTSGSNTATGILSAVDAATGAAKWSVAVPGPFAAQSPPVAARGFVYALDGGMVTAFNESDGSQSWQQTVTGTNGTVAVTVDGVYATAPCASYALQPAIGSVVWTAGTGCGGAGGATPVVGSGRMYSPTGGFFSGSVYDSQAGTLLGTFSASAPPALAAASAYVLGTATLQSIALNNNQVAWQFTGDGALVTAPVVVNGYVFIGSSGGNLYALDATTGTQVWSRNLGAAIPSASTGQSALLSPSGLSAGDGWLIVPAGNTVNAFLLSANP
jgi:outer membrane protein assembly factor BamB